MVLFTHCASEKGRQCVRCVCQWVCVCVVCTDFGGIQNNPYHMWADLVPPLKLTAELSKREAEAASWARDVMIFAVASFCRSCERVFPFDFSSFYLFDFRLVCAEVKEGHKATGILTAWLRPRKNCRRRAGGYRYREADTHTQTYTHTHTHTRPLVLSWKI